MEQFEYKILDVPSKGWWGGKIDINTLLDKLNELGAQGWEVISSTGTNMYEGGTKGLIIILKRKIN